MNFVNFLNRAFVPTSALLGVAYIVFSLDTNAQHVLPIRIFTLLIPDMTLIAGIWQFCIFFDKSVDATIKYLGLAITGLCFVLTEFLLSFTVIYIYGGSGSIPTTWVLAGGIALLCNAFFVHFLKYERYGGHASS